MRPTTAKQLRFCKRKTDPKEGVCSLSTTQQVYNACLAPNPTVERNLDPFRVKNDNIYQYSALVCVFVKFTI